MSGTAERHCLLSLRWRPPFEGGRVSGPPAGPRYVATAVFVLGADAELTPGWPATGEHFSIVLELLGNHDGQELAQARFLAPHLADAYVSLGAELLLMEGPHTVGEARIIDLDEVGNTRSRAKRP